MQKINIRKGLLWKQYGLKCEYCGIRKYYALWWIKLKLIFTDTIVFTCPVCHKTTAYVNIFHLRHDSMSSLEKNRNKEKLWDDRCDC